MTKEDQEQRHGYWHRLVEEQQQSGLSQKEFCKQRKLVLSQFVYYRQLKNKAPQPATNVNSFAPVKVSGKESILATGEIKLSLPNGFQCAFPVYIDATQLKRLVEVLLSC